MAVPNDPSSVVPEDTADMDAAALSVSSVHEEDLLKGHTDNTLPSFEDYSIATLNKQAIEELNTSRASIQSLQKDLFTSQTTVQTLQTQMLQLQSESESRRTALLTAQNSLEASWMECNRLKIQLEDSEDAVKALKE